MRRIWRGLLSGLLFGLAACLTALESVLVWSWVRGTRYVMQYGRLENPYAAEEAEIAGICALILLPLVLAALAWTGYRIIQWKKRAGARTER